MRATLLAAALLLAGCASPGAPGEDGAAAHVACEHPWPCADGSEWPRDLVGPFSVSKIERVQVESHDGTMLNGWVALPDTPGGVKLPAVLHSTPYIGQEEDRGSPEGNSFWNDTGTGMPFRRYIEEGYALLVFQVRGTGNSGGCYEAFGPNEQRDQAVLVDWVASQAWSNGRVGMIGLSYPGTTPIEAAIHAPDALKTIVVAGVVTDVYTFYHTPQGAVRSVGAGEQSGFIADTAPPTNIDEERTTEWPFLAPERACPEVVDALGETGRGAFIDERNSAFWSARRILAGAPNITTAVLLSHGFHDNRGHGYQDDPFWEALPAATPRAFVLGQWSHEWPDSNDFRAEWVLDAWPERVIAWLDHWLKGIGDVPPQLGIVEYQDDAGAWRSSTAWPPIEAAPRALYLADGALSPSVARAATSFRSAPDPLASAITDEAIGFREAEGPGPVCADPLALASAPRLATFETEPLASDLELAGRGFGALTLRSNEPGGLVHVTILDLAPDFACDARGVPSGARWVTSGTADLRFHEGNYVGKDFPVDAPTLVRIDLLDHAAVIPAGHRLAAIVSYGDPSWRAGGAYSPIITIERESHLVLPVVAGTVGVVPPLAQYPPRPFTIAG